ncbi:subunits of heterodimeric actin filament capping protein Capz [Penicillium capsulatum]|uniref:F-actin-capping protein subunit alpha n=1 Tax=Penicillium capsulatum TaxID=69766 RepID=A0A9W9I871_9EURO|nr:subunits of heterodimeric actin filament capping protein Capz [Penicillium capsulatum]
MSSTTELASAFIEGAPPGELPDVVADQATHADTESGVIDVQALTSDGTDIISSLAPAFERYNEKQLATVKLPGSSQEVIVSEFNKVEGNRYFDPESQTSFEVDHTTQTASATQSFPLESQNADLIKSLLKSLGVHAREHYPSCSYGVYPAEDDSAVAILLVANRYSPNNFWNGRFRAIYQVPVSSTSTTLTGKIHVDVHYYEDGNVALNTTKPINLSVPSVSAESIISRIATAERDYQEELNRAFVRTADGAFKGLRRQLPITRQKVEWEKVGGYRLGQDISGSRGITRQTRAPSPIPPFTEVAAAMIGQFSRFVNSGAGLEKTLRLVQAVAQIAAVFTVGSTAVRLTTAKLQLALTRRFFRFFGFLESFQRVSALLGKAGMGTVAGWLDLAKWTCFGLYFVLEDLTMLHAMGVYAVSWEAEVMRQANTFWFYALALSLAGTLYRFFSAPVLPPNSKKGARKNEKSVPAGPDTAALVRQAIVDSCDLLIPAELLDWMPTGDLVLGVTMVVSTVVSGRDIWVGV